jgi:hypothetical protein
MNKYLTTIRVSFDADNEAKAMLVADHLAEVIIGELEDDDTCDVTQTINITAKHLTEPEEVIARLSIARNDLIRTGYRDCFYTAQTIDQLIHALRRRLDPADMLPDYDHGGFIALAHIILNEGGNPL